MFRKRKDKTKKAETSNVEAALLVRSRATKSRYMLTTSGKKKDVPEAVRWNIGFKPNCSFVQPAHWTRLVRLEPGQTNRSGIRAAILFFFYLAGRPPKNSPSCSCVSITLSTSS